MPQWESPTGAGARYRWARWGVVSLLALAAACAYLTRHGLAVANTTIQREIGLTNEQFGYLYGAFSLGYMLFQIPGGWLGKKLGARCVLPWCAVLWSLMTLFTASARSFAGLLVARFLFGIAQAGLVPNQGKVLRDWVPPAARGASSAVLIVAMSVGSIASLSLTSWLMESFPWRNVFVAYACLGIAWAVVFGGLFRNSPNSVRWLRLADHPSPSAITSPQPADGATARTGWSWWSTFRMVSSLSVWGLSVQALFKAAGYNLLVTFLPAVMEYRYGVERDLAGTLTAWTLGPFLVGSMLGGWLVDAIFTLTGSKYASRSATSATALFLAGGLTLVSGYAGSATVMTGGLAIAGFFAGIAGAAPWVASMDLGGRNTAIVLGMLNTFAALAGTVISPPVGRMIDVIKTTEGSWTPVFWLHAGFYGIGAVAWLVVRPDRTLDLGDESDDTVAAQEPS